MRYYILFVILKLYFKLFRMISKKFNGFRFNPPSLQLTSGKFATVDGKALRFNSSQLAANICQEFALEFILLIIFAY